MKCDAIIEANEAYVIRGVNPELYNHALPNGITVKEYVENMVYRGWKRWNGDNKIHVNVKELTVLEMSLVMTLDNGQVLNFHPYVKIPESNINEQVTEGLPNRVYPLIPSYVNEEGETIPEVPERVETWNEWFLNFDREGNQGNNSCLNHEGFNYYYTNVSANGLENLTGSELMIIHNSQNAELVDELPIIEE